MNSKQAKDFLVEQVARQAAIEHVPLSGLEKRMMYFTEGSDAVEDPVSLHEDFEERYDSANYEDKISRLLKHARARLKSEDPAQVKVWKEAVAVLREGDHYILVMVGGLPWGAIARVSMRLVVPGACLVVIGLALKSRFGPLPRVSPYLYSGLLVLVYFAALFLSREKATNAGRVLKAVTSYLFGKR